MDSTNNTTRDTSREEEEKKGQTNIRQCPGLSDMAPYPRSEDWPHNLNPPSTHLTRQYRGGTANNDAYIRHFGHSSNLPDIETASFQNAGVWLNTNTADRPGIFYNQF
jgi:hypothetical protein